LADRLEASLWEITVSGADVETLAAGVERVLAATEIPVERMTKKGLRRFDAREAIVTLEARPAGESANAGETCAILAVVLRHGTPSVRPDDVLAALREVTGLDAGPAALAQRLAQGPLDPRSGTVGDPLSLDRDAAG
jgi:hypothetical protein